MSSTPGKRSHESPFPAPRGTRRGGVKIPEHLAVLEALNLPVSLINRQYVYTWVNSCYSATHGKKPQGIIGRKVPTVWGRKTFDGTVKGKLDRCFKGVEVRDEAWIDFPALGPRYCEVVYSPYRPDARPVVSAIVVTYDITHRKEMERQLKTHEERLEKLVEERTGELRQSEQKFKAIVENATEGIYQITPEGRFLSANPALARIYGYDAPEDFVAEVVNVEQLHVEPERRREFIARLYKEGRIRNFELKMYRKDGSVTWTSVNARIVRDETGSVLYHEGTVQDISQRKQAEEDMLLQHDLALKLAGTSSPGEALPVCLDTGLKVSHMESGGIYIKNRQTGDLELACSAGLSPQFEQKVSLLKVGWSLHATMMGGTPVYLSPHEEGTHPFEKEVREEGFLTRAILPVVHNSEVIACVNLASRILVSVPVQTRATLELIALQLGAIFARIQTEHELREREEHFSRIFQSNPGAMLLTTIEGCCVDCNRAFLDIVGYAREDVLGRTTAELELWLSREKREKKVREIKELGSIHNYETRIRTKSGAFRDILVSIELITQREDRLLLTMFHDMTERKQAEEALEAKSHSLEEANTALKVLLKHREEDRKELEERLVSNVKQLVLPHVEKLKKGRLDPSLRSAVEFVEANLKEILSPFLNNLRSFNFSPRQLEIIALIREGRTTKDIAELLHVSKDTVDKQRFFIRKKLDINKEKANLRSFLLSLA